MTPEVVVFDFDKTLTYKDTVFDFLNLCSKENGIRFRVLRIVLWYIGALLMKSGVISNAGFKRFGVNIFLRGLTREQIASCSRKFRDKVEFNWIYHDVFSVEKDAIIVSASYTEYLRELLPGCRIIASSLKYDAHEKVLGLSNNCYGIEKLRGLNNEGIYWIDRLYTDSYTDFPLMRISSNIFMVRGKKMEKLR